MIGAEESDRFLLCRIGSRIGALALNDVRETMRPLPIEPLPGMPPFVLGVAIVRGFPAPVVDAARLLKPLESPPLPMIPPPSARFVSLKLGERTAVLAVDAVLDIRPLAAGTPADLPPLLRETGAEQLAVIGALDSQLLFVLEAARLVPESAWSALKASEASA
jgi:purine-binding chemotaxis protein CheW